jgi:8-oxo-dGTP diphosphatase
MNYVCGFMADDSGRLVALVRKARPAWQAGRLNGVGGKVEAGETPAQAMVREFSEETGHATAEGDWTLRVRLAFDGGRIDFFAARAAGPLAMPDTLPVEPVGWFPIFELPQLAVIPNLRWLIPLCLDPDIAGPVELRDRSTPEGGSLAREKAAARAGVGAPEYRADPEYTFAPADVVREFFPSLTDVAATNVLWEYTGWPEFFSDAAGATPRQALRTQLAALAADPPEWLKAHRPDPADKNPVNTPPAPGV